MVSNCGFNSTFCSSVYILCSWNDLGSPPFKQWSYWKIMECDFVGAFVWEYNFLGLF